MRKNRTQGFTLIELLIVIAIIAILAAVLIPNLLSARQKANTTAAQAYVRNVATEVEAQREPTGALPGSITTDGVNCDTFVANPPVTISSCLVKDSGDGTNYTIEADLQGASKSKVTWDSETGEFSFQ